LNRGSRLGDTESGWPSFPISKYRRSLMQKTLTTIRPGETANFRRVATFVALCCLAGSVRAQDNAAGPVIVQEDTHLDFAASGTLTVSDVDNPPNGVNKWLNLDGEKWKLSIGYKTGSPPYKKTKKKPLTWWVQDVQLQLRGQLVAAGAAMRAGPGHAEPHPRHREDPNDLVALFSKANSIKFGSLLRRSIKKRKVKHGDHYDHYQARGWPVALPGPGATQIRPPGPTNLLAGAVEVRAAHREENAYSFPILLAMHAGPDGGSTVCFDAETGVLSFTIGAIDGLGWFDGLPGMIDGDFRTDLILDAVWTASSVTIDREGVSRTEDREDTDGPKTYSFSGGEVTLRDPFRTFSFEASFEKFVITNTASWDPLMSFGELSSIDISQENGKLTSEFLESFVDVNLFAHGVPEAEWAHWQGVDFALVTEIDLVKATSGFKHSVCDLPVTYLITANSGRKPLLF